MNEDEIVERAAKKAVRKYFDVVFPEEYSPNESWEEISKGEQEAWRITIGTAITAYKAELAEAGYVIVPFEPTKEMINARTVPGILEGSDVALVWKGMLDARPKS